MHLVKVQVSWSEHPRLYIKKKSYLIDAKNQQLPLPGYSNCTQVENCNNSNGGSSPIDCTCYSNSCGVVERSPVAWIKLINEKLSNLCEGTNKCNCNDSIIHPIPSGSGLQSPTNPAGFYCFCGLHPQEKKKP